MTFTRRQLLIGCAAGAFTPVTACAAKAIGARFTPEAFGAAGDGVSDDYDALRRMIAAVNSAGGGAVAFAPGRKYFLGRYIANGRGAADLTFAGCRALTIEGNGATIAINGAFIRDDPATRSLSGLRFQDCQGVTLRNLTLDGNVNRTSRFAKMVEPPSHGLAFQSCADVTIDKVIARHFAGDGLFIRESKQAGLLGRRMASRRFTVRNSHFLFNARQGMTIGQLRGGIFENCEFSYTGFVDAEGTGGPYGAHSPSAGVDVEPDNTPTHGNRVDVLTGDIFFRSCRMAGNYGAAFLASKFLPGERFLEQVTVQSCHLECNDGLSGGQDGFIFDVPGGAVLGCTLQMKDKTAYLGWYRVSDADPRFAGNTVTGRNSDANRPIFAVRPTTGAPTIENNRFAGEQQQPKPAGGPASAMVFVDNPNAILRNNRFELPGRGFRGGTVGVYLNARLAEQNTYEAEGGGSGPIGIAYAGGTAMRGEIYCGTSPLALKPKSSAR